MKKYLIPPRLNKKYTMWGLTLAELLVIVFSFLIAIVSAKFYLVVIPAAVFATCVRFIDGEENIWQYGKKVYNYFFKSQDYSLIGGGDE